MALLRQCLWEVRAMSEDSHGLDSRSSGPAREVSSHADLLMQNAHSRGVDAGAACAVHAAEAQSEATTNVGKQGG
jgi:hypothetical protein